MAAWLVVGGSATAFDPHPWAKDDINTCIANNSSWTATKIAEVNAAVNAWENQVDGLNINHNPNLGQCSTSGDIEINWVEHLDGDLASTRYGTSGPIWIVFARRYSSGGPWIKWSYDGTPAYDEYDFRSTATHELGHALGLRHPEFHNEYPAYSFDGHIPVMKKGSAEEGTTGRRTLKQDDLHGGWWSGTYDRSGGRQYFTYPASDTKKHWESVLGDPVIQDCGTYICLPKPPDTYLTSMMKRTQFTTDNRRERQTPTVSFDWREANGSYGGHVDVRLYMDPSAPKGTSDIFSPVSAIGGGCRDTHADNTWERCTVTFVEYSSWEVQGVWVEILNTTDGGIHIDNVHVVDDDQRP